MVDLIRAADGACPPIAGKPGLIKAIGSALALRKQRLKLKDLPAAALRDIGLTRDQALAEATRPFWDVPTHWLR